MKSQQIQSGATSDKAEVEQYAKSLRAEFDLIADSKNVYSSTYDEYNSLSGRGGSILKCNGNSIIRVHSVIINSTHQYVFTPPADVYQAIFTITKRSTFSTATTYLANPILVKHDSGYGSPQAEIKIFDDIVVTHGVSVGEILARKHWMYADAVPFAPRNVRREYLFPNPIVLRNNNECLTFALSQTGTVLFGGRIHQTTITWSEE